MPSTTGADDRKRKFEELEGGGGGGLTESSDSHDVDKGELQTFMTQTDIWVNCILPFVGIGQFIFVAGACKRLKDLYKKYVSSLPKTPLVTVPYRQNYRLYMYFYAPCFTFYSAAFANTACAEFWYNDIKDVNYNYLQCSKFCQIAATLGSLPVLQFLRKKNFPWDQQVCCCAATHGHLQVLKWAHQNGCPLLRWIMCAEAAAGGHLEVLKWAHDNGCPWDTDTSYTAAKYGHLEVLKWAHENDCPWDRWTCACAAESGHLEILQYAHEHGCPWDADTCARAAQYGHLEVLKWARENGCPWDGQTLKYAREERHHAILEWALANGCPAYNEEDLET